MAQHTFDDTVVWLYERYVADRGEAGVSIDTVIPSIKRSIEADETVALPDLLSIAIDKVIRHRADRQSNRKMQKLFSSEPGLVPLSDPAWMVTLVLGGGMRKSLRFCAVEDIQAWLLLRQDNVKQATNRLAVDLSLAEFIIRTLQRGTYRTVGDAAADHGFSNWGGEPEDWD